MSGAMRASGTGGARRLGGRPARGSNVRPLGGIFGKRASQAATVQADPTPAAPMATSGPSGLAVATAIAGAAVGGYALRKMFSSGSRPYEGNVGDEYDTWTADGVLEYYWGEHIHLGTYSEEERAVGYRKKDFKQAKLDFIDEMLAWSGAKSPKRILDVGCGIGGTSRHLARAFPDAEVVGVSISPNQIARATELAREQGLTNVRFELMDALAMTFDDGSFDLVWGCESGEHMPDKQKYVEEMTRVLAPGGDLAIATWCQRHSTPETPFSDAEKDDLQFLYDEWAHPYFISIQDYDELLKGTAQFETTGTDDWTASTLPSWRHSIWVGVVDPWIVAAKGPVVWYKTVREIVTLERMHRAFDSGLMQYGMIRGTKQAAPVAETQEEEPKLEWAGEKTSAVATTQAEEPRLEWAGEKTSSVATTPKEEQRLEWVGEKTREEAPRLEWVGEKTSPVTASQEQEPRLEWIGEKSQQEEPKLEWAGEKTEEQEEKLEWVGEKTWNA